MTHRSVMTSSLRINNRKIDKFCEISSDSKIEVFRVVIYLKVNQCKPRRTKGA